MLLLFNLIILSYYYGFYGFILACLFGLILYGLYYFSIDELYKTRQESVFSFDSLTRINHMPMFFRESAQAR